MRKHRDRTGAITFEELVDLSARVANWKHEHGQLIPKRSGYYMRYVRLDPRINGGYPSVNGVLTSILLFRLEAGETVDDLADDYKIEPLAVVEAAALESVEWWETFAVASSDLAALERAEEDFRR